MFFSFLKHANHTHKVSAVMGMFAFFMPLVFVLHSCLMIFNTSYLVIVQMIEVLLKFLGIFIYSFKNMIFLSSFEAKEYFLPHLMLREVG